MVHCQPFRSTLDAYTRDCLVLLQSQHKSLVRDILTLAQRDRQVDIVADLSTPDRAGTLQPNLKHILLTMDPSSASIMSDSSPSQSQQQRLRRHASLQYSSSSSPITRSPNSHHTVKPKIGDAKFFLPQRHASDRRLSLHRPKSRPNVLVTPDEYDSLPPSIQ
jgi:hypothetical protein